MPKKGNTYINVNDIIGRRIGKLEVIEYAGHTYESTIGGNRMRHRYLVRCDCGTVKTARRGQLMGEIVKSCGCMRRNRK